MRRMYGLVRCCRRLPNPSQVLVLGAELDKQRKLQQTALEAQEAFHRAEVAQVTYRTFKAPTLRWPTCLHSLASQHRLMMPLPAGRGGPAAAAAAAAAACDPAVCLPACLPECTQVRATLQARNSELEATVARLQSQLAMQPSAVPAYAANAFAPPSAAPPPQAAAAQGPHDFAMFDPAQRGAQSGGGAPAPAPAQAPMLTNF